MFRYVCASVCMYEGEVRRIGPWTDYEIFFEPNVKDVGLARDWEDIIRPQN